jgi:predicted MFS family arabinose efflux permease
VSTPAAAEPAAHDRLEPGQRVNLAIVTACQGTYFVVAALLTTIGGLAGEVMTANRSLSTAAVAVTAAAAAVFAIPSAAVIRALGRRNGLAVGNAVGIAGGVLSLIAAVRSSFPLLVLGGACFGALAAFTANYRFTAASVVPAFFQSRAISLGVGSGVVAAVIGPSLLQLVPRNAPAAAFAVPYALVALMCAGCVLALLGLRMPAAPAHERAQPAWFRTAPLRALRVPHYRIALVSTTAASVAMNLVMVASPLAMRHHLMLYGVIAAVLQSHYVAMYAPSFATGSLIARYGASRMIAAGGIAIAASALVGLAGEAPWNYALALVLVGLGWNLASVASTTLVMRPVAGIDQYGMQGLYNFTVLVAVSISALGSGAMLERFGWQAIPVATLVVAASWAAAAWANQAFRGGPTSAQNP